MIRVYPELSEAELKERKWKCSDTTLLPSSEQLPAVLEQYRVKTKGELHALSYKHGFMITTMVNSMISIWLSYGSSYTRINIPKWKIMETEGRGCRSTEEAWDFRKYIIAVLANPEMKDSFEDVLTAVKQERLVTPGDLPAPTDPLPDALESMRVKTKAELHTLNQTKNYRLDGSLYSDKILWFVKGDCIALVSKKYLTTIAIHGPDRIWIDECMEFRILLDHDLLGKYRKANKKIPKLRGRRW